MAPVMIGDLRIDRGLRRVTVQEREVSLSPIEFRLLCQLAAHPGQVQSHRALLQSVWGEACANQSEYLHVYIGRLRAKIEPDPAHPSYLATVHGVGYRLREP